MRQIVGTTMTIGNFTCTATPAIKPMVVVDTIVNPTTNGREVASTMTDFDLTQDPLVVGPQ